MKALRQRTSKSVELIAVELQISVSTVRFWEQGRYAPRLLVSDVPKLLKVYECTLDEMVEATLLSQQNYQ